MKKFLIGIMCLAVALAAGTGSLVLACGGGMDHGNMDHGSMYGNTGSGYGHMAQGQMGYGSTGPGGRLGYSRAPQGTWSPAPGAPQERGQVAPAVPNPGTTHDHQH